MTKHAVKLRECDHAGLAFLVEMDRRLAGRGLLLADFARDCELSRSTAGRYLALIVERLGLSVTCRFCTSGEVVDALEAMERKARGKRIYRYADGEEGLFSKRGRQVVRAMFVH